MENETKTETEPKTEKRRPDYKSDGIAVWLNLDPKTNKEYLSINLVGHKIIYAGTNK